MAFQSITRGSTPAVRQGPCSGVVVCAAERVTAATSLIIALLAVPLVVLATRKVQRVLLAIVAFNIPLQIEKHFFLRQDAADLGSLGGLQISLTNVALAGLYISWMAGIVVRHEASPLKRQNLNKVTLPAILLLLLSAISLLVARDITLGAFEVWIVLQLLGMYLYVAKKASREDVLFIVRILMIGLIVQSALMLAQAGGLVGDIDFYGIKTSAEFAGDSRVSGTIGSPNPAGAYLAMMMVVALGVMLTDVARADRYLAGIGLASATLPLIFTLSRGGWLSLLVGLATLSRLRRTPDTLENRRGGGRVTCPVGCSFHRCNQTESGCTVTTTDQQRPECL